MPVVLVLLLLFLIAGGAGFYFWKQNEAIKQRNQEHAVLLDKEGKQYLEARRWDDAGTIYDTIEKLVPRSSLAAEGKARIAAGKEEEEQQYLGYWSGEALAAFESGRWDQAENAAKKVLEKRQNQADMTKLLADVSAGRRAEVRKNKIAEVKSTLEKRDWKKARELAESLAAADSSDSEAKELVASIGKAETEYQSKLAKVKELYGLAKKLDNGSYSDEAIAHLREALSLVPDEPETNELYQKMAAYARTLRVPEEFKTVAAAIEAAKQNDRVVIGAGIWNEAITINKGIVLEGAGAEQTIFETDANASPALTVLEEGRNAHFVGVGFRHRGFAMGAERWSAVLVKGGIGLFTNCRFSQASGHGLAVIEGGRAEGTGCAFIGNGWDGVSCYGVRSSLVLKDCLAEQNQEHGIDVWDGATCILLSTRSNLNTLNGALIASKGVKAVLEKCHFEGNREYGAVLSDMRQGVVSENTSIGNHMGGYAILEGAAGALIEKNIATKNEGPGILVDQGIDPGTLGNNQLTGNQGGEIIVVKPETNENEPPKAIPVE